MADEDKDDNMSDRERRLTPPPLPMATETALAIAQHENDCRENGPVCSLREDLSKEKEARKELEKMFAVFKGEVKSSVRTASILITALCALIMSIAGFAIYGAVGKVVDERLKGLGVSYYIRPVQAETTNLPAPMQNLDKMTSHASK
jgi:hypothetical protein